MKKSMEEYLKEFQTLSKSNDPEAAHGDADVLLLELVEDLSNELHLDCKEIIDAYNNVEKYYA